MDKKRLIPRILLVIYLIVTGIAFFAKFDTGVHISTTWLGLPKDKIVHFLLFLPYPVLMYTAFHRQRGIPSSLLFFMLWVVVAGTVIAGGTELIQGMTDYRSADINDFRADCLGIFVGCVAVTVYGAISKKW